MFFALVLSLLVSLGVDHISRRRRKKTDKIWSFANNEIYLLKRGYSTTQKPPFTVYQTPTEKKSKKKEKHIKRQLNSRSWWWEENEITHAQRAESQRLRDINIKKHDLIENAQMIFDILMHATRNQRNRYSVHIRTQQSASNSIFSCEHWTCMAIGRRSATGVGKRHVNSDQFFTNFIRLKMVLPPSLGGGV